MPIPPRPISRSISYWPARALARAESSDIPGDQESGRSFADAQDKSGIGELGIGTPATTRTARERKMCPTANPREARWSPGGGKFAAPRVHCGSAALPHESGFLEDVLHGDT